jgi:hypothetical protein
MKSKRKSQIKDIKGQRFGKLVVISFSHIWKHLAYWLCICDCRKGRVVITRGTDLRYGASTSCGWCGNHPRILRHGDCTGSKDTKEYRVWDNMIQRCYNPNNRDYKNYGGRGITVCDRWLYSYENFLEDMGRAPGKEYSIDRIDNDGNYEPGNCRWATASQQASNRRSKAEMEKVF